MKTDYLLPNQLKKVGWFFFIPGIILGALYLITGNEPNFLDLKIFALAGDTGNGIVADSSYFTIAETNIFDEIISVLVIIGAILIALSKEKNEDETISKMRLRSLVWAIYLNYTLLAIAIVLVYDSPFLWVLVFNMFTFLFLFIMRFNWVLYKSKKTAIYSTDQELITSRSI
jgi:uncharacterized membrane protein